jgi:hypothetical protein
VSRARVFLLTTALLATWAGCRADDFLDTGLDRSCVPEFPERFDLAGTYAGDVEQRCDPPMEPDDGELPGVQCFAKRDAASECPAADDEETLAAVEASLLYDCGPCLRDEYRVACAILAEADDECCYRYFVREPECSPGS